MADLDYEANRHFYGNAKSQFSYVNVRLGFIRKVYSILSIQLLLTFGISLVSLYTPFGDFQVEYPGLLILAAVLELAFCFSLLCFRKILNQVPTNYIVLFLFTLCEAYSISAIVKSFANNGSINLVIWALVMTVSLTLGLTVYAWTTKSDITTWGGFLFCLSIALIFFALLALFSGLRILQIISAVLGILIYGTYLVFDTQLIIGGKRFQLTVDDYIVAALQLYLDIIVLFLEILKLLALAEK